MEEMRCPYCGAQDFNSDKWETSYFQDGNEIKAITYCNCPKCFKIWKYIEQFTLDYCWNER